MAWLQYIFPTAWHDVIKQCQKVSSLNSWIQILRCSIKTRELHKTTEIFINIFKYMLFDKIIVIWLKFGEVSSKWLIWLTNMSALVQIMAWHRTRTKVLVWTNKAPPTDAYIGSDDGLAPNRRQAIIWTNADPVSHGFQQTFFRVGSAKLFSCRFGYTKLGQ